MTTVRKDNGSLVSMALVALANALVIDVTAIRTALLGALDRGQNGVLTLWDNTATKNDLAELFSQLAATVVDLNALRAFLLICFPRINTSMLGNAAIANGTTAGKFKTVNGVDFLIAGRLYTKAAIDDFWDLSAESDTTGAQWRAYWLFVDSAGAASLGAGTDSEVSEADAIAKLPPEDGSKAIAGVFIAGNSCDFDDAGGLAAQGTIIDGRPVALASPVAITTDDSVPQETDVTVGVSDGGTAGYFATVSDVQFQIDGQVYDKAETDDLWDLSAETDTIAAKYRAYRLYLDPAGAASYEAQTGDDSDSAAEALAALPSEAATKAPIAIFVAGPLTDFDDAGGLSAQGDLYQGRYSAISDPAAITAEAITLVAP